MFRFIKQWIGLSILVFLITGCVAPGLGLYQKALMDRQAAYQQALNQRGAYQQSIQRAAIQQQLARQRADNQQLTNRNSIAVPAPVPEPAIESATVRVPLRPAQLAKQNMMSDTLIGQACNNNFNFEIKITEGHIDGGREDGAFEFIAKLTSNPQSNLQFQTLLKGRVDNNSGVLILRAYKGPSERKGFFDLVRSNDPGLSSDLALYLIKNANGKGWEGTIEGKKFSACDDLSLTSEMGIDISMFPSLKKRDADLLMFSEKQAGPVVQLYWLKRAAALDEDKIYYLGRKYEELGSPENHTLALRTYHDAAERVGDVAAYYGLSRMYSMGLGTKTDPSKSKKWLESAEAAYRSATQVCISPEVIKVFKSIWQEIESRNQAMNYMRNSIAGTNSELGQIVIRKIHANDLITLNKRFSCTATIQRVGARTDMGTPEYYIVNDNKGNVFAYDNSLNKLAANITSEIIDNLVSKASLIHKIKIHPKGNDHYEIYDELDGKLLTNFVSSRRKK